MKNVAKSTTDNKSFTLMEKLEFINLYGVDLDTATIFLSGEITGDLSTALRMRVAVIKKYWECELKKPLREINISINSPGGDATAIAAVLDFYKELEQEKILVNVHAEAICMSAATFIVGGATGIRSASASTRFMVHEVQISGIGGTHTQTKAAQVEIDFLVEQCIKFYTDFTIKKKLTKKVAQEEYKKVSDEWEKRCHKETYFDVEKALEWGLIDKVK